ncbi:MAG: hypothetical protein WC761_04760 [Candidatus Paceibacterota bacterium]|jgi:hypothetical protein
MSSLGKYKKLLLIIPLFLSIIVLFGQNTFAALNNIGDKEVLPGSPQVTETVTNKDASGNKTVRGTWFGGGNTYYEYTLTSAGKKTNWTPYDGGTGDFLKNWGAKIIDNVANVHPGLIAANWLSGFFTDDGRTLQQHYQDAAELVDPSTGLPLSESQNTGECWSITRGLDLMNCISQFLYLVLWLVSFVVSLVGSVFDFVFDKTVRNIATTLKDLTVIQTGWTVIRDLCNIFFIFILLWLGISTILGLNEHGVKHGLSRLIVAAILINFSLLFTQVVIDVPNMIAVTIYDKVTDGGGWANGGRGLGSALFKIVDPEGIGNKMSQKAATETSSATVAAANQSNAAKFSATGSPITTFLMMIIVYATVLFVFLAVCIIFIKRFIILIFLMIFSPLAFLGMAIPIHSLQHEAQHKFWNTLIKESFYAPIFILCFYVTIQVGVAFNVEGAPIIETIFAFTVIIVMMIASLIIAEEMGVSGAGGAMTAFKGMSQGATGFVQSRTIGRVASTLINKADTGDKLRDMAAGKYGSNWVSRGLYTAAGRGIVGTADKLGASFDEKVEKDQKWMEDAISNRHGDHQFTAELFAQNMMGSGMYSADRKMLDNQFHHMSLEKKANMYEYLKDMSNRKVGDDILDAHGHKTGKKVTQKNIDGANAAKKRFFEENGHGRLESDEVAELPRVIAKGLTYHDQKFKEAVEKSTSTDTKAIDKFFETATEGQASAAIRSMSGAAGNKFETPELRAALKKGLKKFKGEAFYASIAKDDTLSEAMRSASAEAGYETKMTWDMSEVLKAGKGSAATQQKFIKNLKEIGDKNLQAALDKFATDSMVDYHKALDTLVEQYQSIRTSDEGTRNYIDSTNGQRAQIKSNEVLKSLRELANDADMKYAEATKFVKGAKEK